MTPYPKPTAAGLIGVFTAVVGQIVAYVPSLQPDAQIVISAGSVVLGAVFTLVSGLVHHKAGTAVAGAQEVARATRQPVQDKAAAELAKTLTHLAASLQPQAAAPAPSPPPAPAQPPQAPPTVGGQA